MITENKNIHTWGFLLIASSLAINLIMFLIILLSKNIEYLPLILLTLVYSIISIILFPSFKLYGKKKSITLLLSLFYLRMVIIPFLLVLFNRSNTMAIDLYFNHYIKTTLLIGYEYICILFTIMFSQKKLLYSKELNINNKSSINNQNFNLIYFIIILFIIFIVYILLKYPYAKSYFKFLFSNSSLNASIENYRNSVIFKNSIPAILYWGFALIFQLIYILLPFILIYKIRKCNKSEKTKIIFSLIVIFAFLCLTTEEKASSAFMAISLLFYLIELYPKHKKKIYKSLIVLVIITIFAIFLKNGIENHKTDFVKMIQSYFSGPYYINTVFNMNSSYNFGKIIPDIMSSLAYIKYFFSDIITSNDLYNMTYYGNSIQQDKIMPMIAQSYYYFGFLLSPIISVLTARLAMLVESKLNLKNENNQFKRFVNIYLVVVFSTSIITYNFTIIISKFTGTIFPLLVICLLTDKFKFCLNRERMVINNGENK